MMSLTARTFSSAISEPTRELAVGNAIPCRGARHAGSSDGWPRPRRYSTQFASSASIWGTPPLKAPGAACPFLGPAQAPACRRA